MAKTKIMEIPYICQGLAKEVELVGYVCIYEENCLSQLWGLSKETPSPQNRQSGKIINQLEIHELELELKL